MTLLKKQSGINKRAIQSPIGLIITLIFTIFSINIILVIFEDLFLSQTTLKIALIDGFLLVLFLTPILYFFVFRPMITNNRKLRLNEEEIIKFKLGIENSVEAIFITNLQGEIIYSNSAFEKIYGYSKEEVIGKTPHIFKSGVLPSEIYQSFWATLFEKKIVAGEIINKTKDGRIINIDGSNTPILDATGKIIGFLGVHRDITERKQVEVEKNILYEITHAVTVTSNLNELLKSIHTLLSKIIYAENCFFALYDQNTGLYSFPFYIDQFDTTPSPVDMQKSCTAYVYRTGKPLLITPEVFKQLKDQNEVELVGSPSPSWIGIPLKTSAHTIGVLVLQNYEKENVYNPETLKFLDSIASQVANVIERKRAEDELEKSHSLLSATLESTADGILVVDKDGKTVNFNEKFVKLWNIPESILAARNDEKLLTYVLEQLKNPDAFLKKVQELYLNEEEISSDIIEFKDGRTFARYSQSQKFNGKVVGRVWSFQDITKRKKAEEELAKSEEKFRTFFEKSPIGIEIYDAAGIQTDSNLASLEIFGVEDKSSTLGFNIFDGTSLTEEIKQKLQRGEQVEYLTSFDFDKVRELNQYNTKRTGKAEMQYSITPLKSAAKESVLGYLLLVRDITKLKKAEEAVKETKEFLDESQRIAKMGSWELDIMKQTVRWSENCFALYGLKPFEITPTYEYFISRIHPDDIHIIEEEFNNIEKNKITSITELRILFPDGSFKWIQNEMVPVFIDDKFIGLKGINIDITERKQVEEKIKQSELSLRELNATKDKFFSIIAHDLKNPFNAILGFSEILKEQVKGKDYQGIEKYASIIQNSSQKAMDLLTNLLEWSQSQTGKINFNPEYFEIGAVIYHVIDLLNDTAHQKSIIIISTLAQKLPVFADKYMISTILRNLVSNALKFTNPGGEIIISLVQTSEDLIFTIKDNGVGMDDETKNNLFRIDKNTSATGTQNEKGTGLGLILCNEFIKKHKGKIWVQSELSKGTKFHFSIPKF